MAEVITRFRVNVNGVEQDARVCYQNLANKPTFKTINGKAVVVSSGDTETDLKLATAEETAALRNRVTNLEQNGTGGGGGSGTPYDDTEVRTLITAEQNRATAKENELEQKVNKKLDSVMFQDFAASVESTKQDKLISGTNIKTINGTSILGSGNITISGGSGGADISGLENRVKALENFVDYAESNYATTGATAELIDQKISAALAAIPVAEGGAY